MSRSQFSTCLIALNLFSFCVLAADEIPSRNAISASRQLIELTDKLAEIYREEGPCNYNFYMSDLLENLSLSESLVGKDKTRKLLKKYENIEKVLSPALAYHTFASDFTQHNLENLDKALSQAHFYSQASGSMGALVELEFNSKGRVTKKTLVVLDQEPYISHSETKGTWKILSIDKTQGFALIEITSEKNPNIYKLQFNYEQMDFLLVNPKSPDATDGTFINLPSECDA